MLERVLHEIDSKISLSAGIGLLKASSDNTNQELVKVLEDTQLWLRLNGFRSSQVLKVRVIGSARPTVVEITVNNLGRESIIKIQESELSIAKKLFQSILINMELNPSLQQLREHLKLNLNREGITLYNNHFDGINTYLESMRLDRSSLLVEMIIQTSNSDGTKFYILSYKINGSFGVELVSKFEREYKIYNGIVSNWGRDILGFEQYELLINIIESHMSSNRGVDKSNIVSVSLFNNSVEVSYKVGDSVEKRSISYEDLNSSIDT